jgi:hypothetical protein
LKLAGVDQAADVIGPAPQKGGGFRSGHERRKSGDGFIENWVRASCW